MMGGLLPRPTYSDNIQAAKRQEGNQYQRIDDGRQQGPKIAPQAVTPDAEGDAVHAQSDG